VPCLHSCPPCYDTQIVMGKEVPKPELERLSKQFAGLTTGLVAWPYLDLPFTPWRRCAEPWRALWAAAMFASRQSTVPHAEALCRTRRTQPMPACRQAPFAFAEISFLVYVVIRHVACT